MKNYKSYYFFILLAGIMASLLSASPVKAQELIDEVKVANQAFYEAFSNRDINEMENVWSREPYVRNINPNGKEIIEGWEAVKEHWSSVFSRFNPITISMENEDIRIGPQTAWVVGKETFQGVLDDGNVITFTVLATNIFEKKNGEWLMVHHHGSAVPE